MFGPHRQVVVNLPRGSACFPPKVFLQSHVVMLPEPKAVSGTRKNVFCVEPGNKLCGTVRLHFRYPC